MTWHISKFLIYQIFLKVERILQRASRVFLKAEIMKYFKVINPIFWAAIAFPALAVCPSGTSIPIPGTIPLVAAGLAIGLMMHLRNNRK